VTPPAENAGAAAGAAVDPGELSSGAAATARTAPTADRAGTGGGPAASGCAVAAGSASDKVSIAEPAAEAATPASAAQGAAPGRGECGGTGAGAAGVEVGPPPAERGDVTTGDPPRTTESPAAAAGDAAFTADTGAVARTTPPANTWRGCGGGTAGGAAADALLPLPTEITAVAARTAADRADAPGAAAFVAAAADNIGAAARTTPPADMWQGEGRGDRRRHEGGRRGVPVGRNHGGGGGGGCPRPAGKARVGGCRCGRPPRGTRVRR